MCKPNQQITYVASLHQTASIRCEVEAVPSDVTFRWEFTNSVHKHYDLQHIAKGLVSVAAYRPETPADYGTLFCWANNSVGYQQTSCFFTVIAPGNFFITIEMIKAVKFVITVKIFKTILYISYLISSL